MAFNSINSTIRFQNTLLLNWHARFVVLCHLLDLHSTDLLVVRVENGSRVTSVGRKDVVAVEEDGCAGGSTEREI